MAIPTFIQESWFGRTIFQIQGDLLSVTFCQPDKEGRLIDYHLKLRRIDPNYVPQGIRSYRLLAVPGIVLVLCAVVIWITFRQTLVPFEALLLFYRWAAIGFVVALVVAIKSSSRIEFYQFRDQWGKPLFHIIRDRKQAAECSAFVQELVARIEIAQADLTADERHREIQRLEGETTALLPEPPWAGRWSLSIFLGLVSAGLPFIPGLDAYLAGFQFFIIFPACVCSLVAGILSFQAREPNRWWSLVGLVLSLAPIFSIEWSS